MKTTLFTHVTVAFSCCLATLTACAGPGTEIDPIGNAPVTISASMSGEVVTKADNNYQPAEGNKKNCKDKAKKPSAQAFIKIIFKFFEFF